MNLPAEARGLSAPGFPHEPRVHSHQGGGEGEPEAYEDEVDDREPARVERQPGRPREDHEGGGEVAEAHEEAVHGLLGLVLLLAEVGSHRSCLAVFMRE